MPKQSLNWKVAGAAGEGIKTTGLMFSKMCLRHGLFTFDYTEYPSLIRGGHNTYQVMAGMEKVYSQEYDIDVLIALNQNAVKYHHPELTHDSVVIYDSTDDKYDINQYAIKGSIYDVPLVALAKEAGGERVMANNVALGVSAALFKLDITILDQIISEIFKSKGESVISLNQKSAHLGFDYVQKNLKPLSNIIVSKRETNEPIALTGNEALSLGAIAGGMKAYIAYPMTPSSSILHTLADWSEKADIMVKHAEDEIGVINMAIGAGFAGVRAACGTSGGGFAYMTEAVGLSGVAEIPLVIYECQRPGPALGMPTWTAQADLLFVINASQDEFPRLVFCPGDIIDAFELSRMSFELAEKYQLPVIVLSDKHLSESGMSAPMFPAKYTIERFGFNQKPEVDQTGFYPRYQDTPNGVTPRSIPGTKDGYFIANSYEHDVHGIASEEVSDRNVQMDKRFRKLDEIKTVIPPQFYDGSEHPEITFITFGSTKLAVQAALRQLRHVGIDAALYNISWIWPFPVEQTINVIQKSANPVVVEGNKTNQLARLIRQETGIDVYHKRTKYDGRPFYPSEIMNYAKEILNRGL